MKRYKIIRFFFNGGNEIIKTGLTESQAKKHCKNPETSSSTATSQVALELTKLRGPWFDGFDEE